MKIYVGERAKLLPRIEELKGLLNHVHKWTGVYAVVIVSYYENDRPWHVELSTSNDEAPATCQGGLKIAKNLIDLPIVERCTMRLVDGTMVMFVMCEDSFDIPTPKAILLYWDPSSRDARDFDDALCRIAKMVMEPEETV